VTDYRARSLWLDCLPGELTPRRSLEGPIDVDVAVVGAGFTGLWTAYYLKKADPHLRIVVLEREIAGHGGSGRNGGWCHTTFPGSRERAAKSHGRQATIDQQRALFDTVDEIARVVKEEDIDARFHDGGQLDLATNPVQLLRAAQDIEYQRSWGFGEDDYVLLGAREARERMQVAGCLGAVLCKHAAVVDPARLARGLADIVEKLGVPIYEQTPVTAISPHAAETPFGTVKAEVVVRATEAFTPELPGYERWVVPIYSLMIATEPLSEATWERLGWKGHEAFGDMRHLIFYACRTEDGRIAIGGRGAPYHYDSKLSEDFTRNAQVQDRLRELIRTLFPQIGEFRISHYWGGAIAASRDWYSSVGINRSTGIAWAGAYVGDGVSTTNLAGRTLCDLIRDHATPLTRLPWVNHNSPLWEPEPFRWVGVNLALRMMSSADKFEDTKGRPSRRADLVSKMIGA
jgi:glycine/D-amino acid oxidase-like deaminating enzyme